MKRNLRTLLLTRVYNGRSTTIFCVTLCNKKIVEYYNYHSSKPEKDKPLCGGSSTPAVSILTTNDLCVHAITRRRKNLNIKQRRWTTIHPTQTLITSNTLPSTPKILIDRNSVNQGEGKVLGVRCEVVKCEVPVRGRL